MKKNAIMMQKLQKLCGLVLTLVLWSGIVLAQETKEPVKGLLRIKLQSELTEGDQQIATRSGIAKTGRKAIDVMNSRLKVSSMKRMFPYSAKYEERMKKHGLHLWYEVRYDENISPAEAAQAFRSVADVEKVDIVRPMVLMDGSRSVGQDFTSAAAPATRATTAPFNDPQLREQWHYNNDGSIVGSIAGSDANLFKAWEITTGSKDVIVAIIDGGVDYNHEDLKGQIWVNEAELNGTEGVDDDGNGYIDDIYGWNFIRNSNLIYPHEHGTHVAGTVGAINNNGIGVCGVAGGSGNQDGVTMMSCQVFDVVEGNGETEFAKSIVYAANNGAVIAQCSWGWNAPDYSEASVEEAIRYFVAEAGNYEGSPMKGGVCFFATGNLGIHGDFYPAAMPEVIAVGAMTADFKVATYTNNGSTLDILAPGGDGEFDQRLAVLSTKPHNTYGYLDGTSMATPHVSGVAALVLSKFGGKDFTSEDLKKHILTAVKDIYANNPDWVGRAGRGYLDAELALRENQQKAPEQITEFKLLASQEDIGVEWVIPDDADDHQIEKHLVYSSTSSFTAESDLSTLQVTEIDTKFEKVGTTLLKEITDLNSATEYWIAIQAVDRWGNKSVLSPVQSAKTNSGPVVTIDPEFGMFLNVDVSQSYTESAVLTATNTGEGLLKWNAVLRQKSPDYFPPMVMNLNKARSSAIAPYSGQIKSTTRESQEIVKADFMEEDFPKSISYYKDYAYDIGEMDDQTLTNSMAQYFRIPIEEYPEGFNLTHLSIQGVNPQGRAIIEIYGDSKSITTAPLLLSDTLPSLDYQSDYIFSSQLHFGPEEGFWLVIHLAAQNEHAFGIGEQNSVGFNTYCFYSNDMGKNWSSLYDVLKNSNISAMADKAVYTVTAVSKYADLQGYLTVSPSEGKTSPGESATITLETQKMDIPDGDYQFNLMFNCNETGHRQRIIPVSLNLSGHKPVLNSARIVNFGDVFVGKSKTVEVEIINTGYGNFEGEWGDYLVEFSDPMQFQVDMDQLMYILPRLQARSKRKLPITYKPLRAGTHTSTVTLTDKNGLTHQFTLRGIADEPAHIAVAPTDIDAGELVYGETPKTFTVQITNTGNYPLEYLFPHFSDDSLTGLSHTSHKFGYSYVSNLNDPAEYTYKWDDLINATDIAVQLNDDNNLSGAIDLGFNFPYYGQTYDKIYISSYGAVSLTGEGFELMMCRQALSSDPMCVAGMGVISALGMPLQFDNNSKLLYAKQNGQFVISYENALLETWMGMVSLSFRIVLSENGDIEMYFRDYDVTQLNNGGQDIFIGFADPNVEDPFVITDVEQVLNSNFADQTFTLFGNEKALRMTAPGSSLIREIDYPYGIVAAGETKNVTLTVAADTTMYTGELKNTVTLLSTDPDKSTSYITMKATIKGDRYKPLVELNTALLDLGTQFRTAIVKGAVTIKNAGQSPVELTEIRLANTEMQLSVPMLPYTLLPGSSIDAVITVPSDLSREFENVLTVKASNNQTLTADIKAKIIGTPAISLTPSMITETIAAGTSKSAIQQVKNTGDEPLTFTIQHHPYYYAANTVSATGEESDYMYASSLNDKNVVYEWEDITETGKHTRLDYLAIHDYVKVPIPDKFIFYGQAFDTMYIYGNGFLTFQSYTDGNHLMPNPPEKIPDVTNPFINYIAPFWAMHAPAENNSSGIYHEIKDDRIIISFMEYGNVVNSGQNAQVILYNTGKIKFQYCMEDDGQQTAFFGIAGLENENHTKGIKLPGRYIALNQAVEFYPVKNITLQPNGSKSIPMVVDATDILAGSYDENVPVKTNVPGQEETGISLSLNVTGQAQAEFPDKVDFGDILVNDYNQEKMERRFKVGNIGTAAFRIMDFYLKHSGDICNIQCTSDNGGGGGGDIPSPDLPGPDGPGIPDLPMPGIPASNVPTTAHYYGQPIEVGKKTQEFLVNFSSFFSEPQIIKDTIVFVTDLPDATVEIPMFVNVVNPPEMDIDQKDINLYAAVDTAVFDSVITLSNANGQYKLDYTVTLESSSTAVTTTASALASHTPAPAAIIPAGAVRMQQSASTYADEDLFPDTEFLRELRYETIGSPLGFLGTGNEVTPFQAITVYKAPADGFNIYAIECLASLKGIDGGEIQAEIQVGSTYTSAQTIARGSLYISDDKEEFRTIKLERPVYLNPNETFYVRLKFPVGVSHALAIITMAEQEVVERYYGFIGEQWMDLISFAATNGTVGYVMRCLETEAGSPWISITENAAGSIPMGESKEFTIHVNAKSARYMKGNQATVRVTGDVNPEVFQHTFKVTLDKNYGPEITRLTTDIEIQEDDTAEVKFKVTDKEGDAFTVSIEDEANIAKEQLDQNDLTVTLHPAFGQSGNQSFTVVATDQFDNASRLTVDYYVKKNNRAPIVLAKPEAIKNNLGTVIEPLDLSTVFSDPDGDVLTYTTKSSEESIALGFVKDGYLEFIQKAQGETEITIIATDPYGLSDTTSVDLELLRSKNVNESDKITVYPNPVVYLLTINCPASIEGETLVRIYNMGGTLVYSEKTNLDPGSTKTLDMANFPAGVYILELVCEGEKMSTKIVKQ